MAILVDKNTRVIVQGITGYQGEFHTKLMLEYGTKIVAGVTPGKGGLLVHGIPVYDTIEEALIEKEANASICFVPAPYAKSAILEAIDAGLNIITVITERIPIHDSMEVVKYAKDRGTVLIGPNTAGVISPIECKLGIMPSHIFQRGKVGIISRSGTLTYEIASTLTRKGLGQSTCVGIGGDLITGLNFIEVLQMFEMDEETEAMVIIGEIGGSSEEEAAEYIKDHIKKPVVAYIAGRTAPSGKRMGHAGAIVSGRTGTAETKIKALNSVGVAIAERPVETGDLITKMLAS